MKYNLIKIILLVFTLLITVQAKAADFGFKPSNVYSIWLNINQVFLQYQSHSNLSLKAQNQIFAIKSERFTDKQPRDVYRQVEDVKKMLESAFGLPEISRQPVWVDHYKTLQYQQVEETIHPSSVFILSSQLLRALVDQYIQVTQSRLPVSQFYSDVEVVDKTPSDVFAQVDLLKRRLAYYIEFKNIQAQLGQGG